MIASEQVSGPAGQAPYSAGATLDAGNNVIERTLSLPGGVAITKRTGGTGDVWSYTNIHGDVAATCNSAGVKQGTTFTYDPYGNALAGLPDNSDGNIDTGWTGQRPLEHEASMLPLIQMGARSYAPVLGRFLQMDPVLGGNDTDFSYALDPINFSDYSGLYTYGENYLADILAFLTWLSVYLSQLGQSQATMHDVRIFAKIVIPEWNSENSDLQNRVAAGQNYYGSSASVALAELKKQDCPMSGCQAITTPDEFLMGVGDALTDGACWAGKTFGWGWVVRSIWQLGVEHDSEKAAKEAGGAGVSSVVLKLLTRTASGPVALAATGVDFACSTGMAPH